jgi:hypothetical protein
VVAPSGGSAGLIILPSVTTASIKFAASNVVANAGAYLVTVSAAFSSSPSTIVASASLTYTYVDPCLANYFYYKGSGKFASGSYQVGSSSI